MNRIRRIGAVTAATAMVALVTIAASACGSSSSSTGGTPTSAGATTNGLEKKSPADVLQAAAAALETAKSVHVMGAGTGLNQAFVDAHLQPGSSTGVIRIAGVQLEVTIIGRIGYVKADQAGLKKIGAPQQVQHLAAGRWLRVPARDFTGFSLASLAYQLTAYQGPLEPKVRQATLNGRKVVVVSWRNGGVLYVANTGPAYPLRASLKGHSGGLINFTEYGAPLHITAPGNALNLMG